MVDLPDPTLPTMETNYPASIFRFSIDRAYLFFGALSITSGSEFSKLSLRLASDMTDFFFFYFFFFFFSGSTAFFGFFFPFLGFF